MSGPELEKWLILGSSKHTRNPTMISWTFCSTDWWTSEFRHFCNRNFEKLNERSYHTSNNNDWNKTLPHLYTLLDLIETPTRLEYQTKGHDKWNRSNINFLNINSPFSTITFSVIIVFVGLIRVQTGGPTARWCNDDFEKFLVEIKLFLNYGP